MEIHRLRIWLISVLLLINSPHVFGQEDEEDESLASSFFTGKIFFLLYIISFNVW